MTTPICSLMGRRTPLVRALKGSDFFPVGMELEFENVRHMGEFDLWQVHNDGSLRNRGREYVTNGPIKRRDVLDEMVRELCAHGAEHAFACTVRTGIHLHINMQDRTTEDVRNILLAYCLAEPVLYDYCGDMRDQNPYCIPWFDGDREARLAMRGLHALERPAGRALANQIINTANKYAGLYVGPLRSFGTIEFRHLQTTLSPSRIMRWVDMVQALCLYGAGSNLAERVLREDSDLLIDEVLAAIGVPRGVSYDERDAWAPISVALPYLVREVPVEAWRMVNTQPIRVPLRDRPPPDGGFTWDEGDRPMMRIRRRPLDMAELDEGPPDPDWYDDDPDEP